MTEVLAFPSVFYYCDGFCCCVFRGLGRWREGAFGFPSPTPTGEARRKREGWSTEASSERLLWKDELRFSGRQKDVVLPTPGTSAASAPPRSTG